MWQCKKCNFKNSNSSEKCHGGMCEGLRDSDAFEMPISVMNANEEKEETVVDYCPVCKKNQFFSKDSRKTFRWRWKCHSCKKLFHRKKDKKPKKQLTVPDDTWDGQ